MKKALILAVTHAAALVIGFAAGIYVLPILIAPEAPSAAAVKTAASDAQYSAQFRRDLRGSDPLHWGEGTVSVGRKAVTLDGRVAPGPDYKLYLAPEFVETKDEFLSLKERALRIGDVKTFENFIVAVPASVVTVKSRYVPAADAVLRSAFSRMLQVLMITRSARGRTVVGSQPAPSSTSARGRPCTSPSTRRKPRWSRAPRRFSSLIARG